MSQLEHHMHVEVRLKSLAKLVSEMRTAQTFYFSVARASDAVRTDALNASKRKEKEVDSFLRMLKYEKLIP